MALDSVRDVGIVIYRIPRVKDIGMVSQNYLHFAFKNKDEFLPIVDRGLGGLNRGGFQSDDKRFHMAVFLLKP